MNRLERNSKYIRYGSNTPKMQFNLFLMGEMEQKNLIEDYIELMLFGRIFKYLDH
jgi:hypothetical protein